MGGRQRHRPNGRDGRTVVSGNSYASWADWQRPASTQAWSSTPAPTPSGRYNATTAPIINSCFAYARYHWSTLAESHCADDYFNAVWAAKTSWGANVGAATPAQVARAWGRGTPTLLERGVPASWWPASPVTAGCSASVRPAARQGGISHRF